MKKSDPHRLYIFLMGGSLLLLVLFQSYWLTKVYSEQKGHFQRETDNIFGNTVRDLQDSMMRRNLIISPDSLKHEGGNIIRFNSGGASSTRTTLMISLDSVSKHPRKDSITRSRFQIIYRDHHPNDRGPGRMSFRRSIEAAVRKAPKGAPIFVKLSTDSLRLTTLRKKITAALAKRNINLNFTLQRLDSIPESLLPMSGIFNVAPANFPPTQFFYSEFPNYQGHLYRKMIPHVFFSLFLLGLTALSFFLIFRNLRQQQRLSKLKNDFISNITHELKTPISTVGVALEALNNFNALNNPERTREYLEISRHELNRLSILVDRVLKMSMFENQALELQKESFDFKLTIENILKSLRLQFEKQDAQVNFQAHGTYFCVDGDPIHLTNVLYNLLDNALKYSKNQPKIDVDLSVANEALQLKVKDQGIGIAPEYQSKVFDQFFRVPNENRHNIKGYGLGLSYVAGVVDLHGGRIAVESALGEGTCFTIWLPCKIG